MQELEAEAWLAAVRRRPWRAALAAAARRRPALAAHGTAPLALLPLCGGQRALVVGDPWARLAVPLARRLAVTALLPSAAAAALTAAVAGQEGVAVAACAGTLAAPPFAAGRFDLVVLCDDLAAEPHLLAAADLLAADGRLYAGAANPLAGAAAPADALTLTELRARVAEAGLAPAREYACFPDAAAPRWLVPLRLVGEFLRQQPGASADLARSGIAEHLAPAFAFVLRRG